MPWKPSFPGELPSLGWSLLEWWAEVLPSPRDPDSPLILTDEQALILVDWYRFDPVTLRFLYRRGASRRSKGWGKALAVDTPLATPAGWTTMGDVQVGDDLLDEHGRPTRVVAATEVMHGRPCFRVRFRDGTSVVADAEHLWPMDEFVGGPKRRRVLVTTQEMFERGVRFARPLTRGRTKCSTDGVARWRTLPTPELDGPDVDFPLPPYLLGYWLGDGDSDAARVTIHADDLEHFRARCELAGIACGAPRSKTGDTCRVTFGSAGRGHHDAAVGLRALRVMGVLNNKHIPPFAFRASYKQRLELLRGLMDSDGTISPNGIIEFCVTSERLAHDVVALMRTLGLYPRMTVADAAISGRVVGARYRIHVTAFDDEPVFSLPRKMARLRRRGPQTPYSQVRTVVAVEPVESVPVRCVSVSGTSQLYLAGEGMVPTHNSPMLAAMAIAELAGDVRPDGFNSAGQPVGRPWGTKGDPNAWVQLAAVSEDQVQNTYSVVYELLSANDGRAADTLRIDMGLTRCFLIDRPGKLEPVTASAGSREGQPITFAVMDETHLWTPTNGGVKLANTLRRNVGKMSGRTYETTNSFAPGEGSVAEETHRAVALLGKGGIFYDAVEAPEVKPEDSDETLKAALQVAYGGAYWVDLDRLVEEVRDPSMPWEDAERFFFNHNVDDRQKAVETKKWLSLRRVWTVPEGTPVGLGFDGSLSDDTTALVGCVILSEDQAAAVNAANPDLPPVPPGTPFTFEIEVWSRPEGAPPNWRVPRSDIRARVKEAFNYYLVGLMLCDPAKWQTEIEFWIEEYGEERVVMFDTNQPTRMWRACDRFSVAVDEGAYVWDADGATVSEHVLALHRRKVRVKDEDDDGRTKFVFVKGPDRAKIDAGIAAVLALEAAQTMPTPKPSVDGALFGMSEEEMAEYERMFGGGS